MSTIKRSVLHQTKFMSARNHMQFSICTAIESCYYNNPSHLGPPDSMAVRHPRYFRKAIDLGPIAIFVSFALGVKLTCWSSQYFSTFLSSAFLATFPFFGFYMSYTRWRRCQDISHPRQVISGVGSTQELGQLN